RRRASFESDGPALGERPLRVVGRSGSSVGPGGLAVSGPRIRYRARRARGRRGSAAHRVPARPRRRGARAAGHRRRVRSERADPALFRASGWDPGAVQDRMTADRLAREDVRVGVDVGGTFTDLVACDSAGRTTSLKVPTTPSNPAGGVLDGLAAVARVAGRCASLAHGTTLVTNAIIERRVGAVGLVTTRGFGDVLEIGRMNRPHLYRIDLPAKPEPLVPRRLRAEIGERVGPDGSVLTPLDLGELPKIIERFRREGVDSVAICLLH